jgi:oligopeptide transport system permease protein
VSVTPRETELTAPPVAASDRYAGAPVRQSSLWRDAWRRYRRNRGAFVAGAIFVLLLLYCYLVPGFWKIPGIWTSLADIDPYAVEFGEARESPSWDHPLGTDRFGRDMLARTALGGQVSIQIGFAATIVILLIGIAYGSISGFVGGRVDNGMMRFLDALYGLPYLPFAIITLAIIGTINIWTMTIALSVATWFTTARIVRGQIITLKENDYVRAAKAVGARWYRILGRHLLPNTLGVLIIAVFLELPGVVLGEAFLSFIGLGISPPEASWGAMAQDGRVVYRVQPLLMVIPSVAIATLVLCANFVADGLRDALDPRTRES